MQVNLSYNPMAAVKALIKAGVALCAAILVAFVLKIAVALVPGLTVTTEHASLLAAALTFWWCKDLLAGVWQ